jgi:hypothetical protein
VCRATVRISRPLGTMPVMVLAADSNSIRGHGPYPFLRLGLHTYLPIPNAPQHFGKGLRTTFLSQASRMP